MNVCTFNSKIEPILFFLICFLGLVIFPIVFNIKIIPKIEERLGRKIIFNKAPYYYFMPKFMQPLGWWSDVVGYFFYEAIGFLIRKKLKNTASALTDSGYDIRQSTKFEVIAIVVAIIIGAIFFSSIFFWMYTHHVYNCSY